MPEIILKNITKRFGKSVAVDNLNLVLRMEILYLCLVRPDVARPQLFV